jgi:hypothetical protein
VLELVVALLVPQVVMVVQVVVVQVVVAVELWQEV